MGQNMRHLLIKSLKFADHYKRSIKLLENLKLIPKN